MLKDTDGEAFGVRGQGIEFDAFVHDGKRFLVEVKSFAEPEDVLVFFRKLQFAERRLNEPFEKPLIAPFADEQAVRLARELGIPILPAEREEEAQPAVAACRINAAGAPKPAPLRCPGAAIRAG